MLHWALSGNWPISHSVQSWWISTWFTPYTLLKILWNITCTLFGCTVLVDKYWFTPYVHSYKFSTNHLHIFQYSVLMDLYWHTPHTLLKMLVKFQIYCKRSTHYKKKFPRNQLHIVQYIVRMDRYWFSPCTLLIKLLLRSPTQTSLYCTVQYSEVLVHTLKNFPEITCLYSKYTAQKSF
jgi:hypothetical protein